MDRPAHKGYPTPVATAAAAAEPQIRAAFEARMSAGGRWPEAIYRDAEGEYILQQARLAWTTWQEAWTASAKACGQPVAGESVMVEAVAEVVDTDDGLALRWLLEGGIAAMSDGDVLVMPHSPITDADGSGEVYTAALAPVGLTDEQIDAAINAWFEQEAFPKDAGPQFRRRMRAAFAAVGIKAGKDGAAA